MFRSSARANSAWLLSDCAKPGFSLCALLATPTSSACQRTSGGCSATIVRAPRRFPVSSFAISRSASSMFPALSWTL